MSIWLSRGSAWLVGAPSVSMKLPFRAYIGCSTTDSREGVEIGSALAYLSEQQAFAKVEYEFLRWSNVLPSLQSFMKKKGWLGKRSGGLRFEFLFEKSEGTGFDTAAEIGLIAALYLLYDAVTKEELAHMVALTGDDVWNGKSERGLRFREMHNEAIKLFAASFFGAVSNGVIFTCSTDTPHPTVSVTEERGGTSTTPLRALSPAAVIDDLSPLDHVRWWTLKLEELMPISGHFPLDVISVHPATTSEPFVAIEYYHKVIAPLFSRLQKDMAALFAATSVPTDEHCPPFLTQHQAQG